MSLVESEVHGISRSSSRYTVTVYVAYPGVMCSDGTPSQVGHMWFSVDDNQTGARSVYGFAPKKHGRGFGEGAVKTTDCDYYTKYDSWVMPVTESQCKTMLQAAENARQNGTFGYYIGGTNSCVDFTWDVLHQAGIGTNMGYDPDGKLLPGQNIPYINRALEEQAAKHGCSLAQSRTNNEDKGAMALADVREALARLSAENDRAFAQAQSAQRETGRTAAAPMEYGRA